MILSRSQITTGQDKTRQRQKNITHKTHLLRATEAALALGAHICSPHKILLCMAGHLRGCA